MHNNNPTAQPDQVAASGSTNNDHGIPSMPSSMDSPEGSSTNSRSKLLQDCDSELIPRTKLQLVDEIKCANQLSLDFRLSLFGSALHSMKATTLLKPYPVEFLDQTELEIDCDKLKSIFDLVPSIPVMHSAPQNVQTLVHWILTHGSVTLDPIQPTELDPKASTILQENLSTAHPNQYTKPHYLHPLHIFSVSEAPARRAKMNKFTVLKHQHGSFYAFHGSQLENFHSILHNGLAMSMNKRSLFGFGTYLSSKLAMSVEYSPFGFNGYGKGRSLLGKKLSCVALCEIINHPEVESKRKKQGIPDTYYVVTNNDLIRVAYLLVYSSTSNGNVIQSSSKSIPDATATTGTNDTSSRTNPSTSSDTVATTSQQQQQREQRERDHDNSSSLFLLAIILAFMVIGYCVTRKPDYLN